MDGRVQEPIRKWMVGRYGIRYVDVVTRPGIDGMVASGRETRGIRDMIEISLNAHGSTTIVVSGHHDCAGNPVGEAAHREDIRESVRRLAEWYPDAKVVGVWVNAEWEVDLVA